jgi:hypothetical protein
MEGSISRMTSRIFNQNQPGGLRFLGLFQNPPFTEVSRVAFPPGDVNTTYNKYYIGPGKNGFCFSAYWENPEQFTNTNPATTRVREN